VSAHYFKFSRDFDGPDRICGECQLTYDRGEHVLIDRLKPYTNYVCPTGGGLGHSGISTGAYRPVNRALSDHRCVCGVEFVEEDKETWRLSWEMQTPLSPDWTRQSVVRSKHAAQQQHAGLIDLRNQGEPIRNVTLVQVVEVQVQP
jgi:hypothetical protein